MRSLAATHSAAAADPLRGILTDAHRSVSTRSVAAEALAAIAPPNAPETARTLASAGAMQDRLLAALSLPDKADARGVEVLVTLAQDAEPAVASVAVQKLLTGSPDSLAPLVSKLTNNPDAIVRHNIVSVLQRHADAPNILLLGQLLNDKAPKVREAARESLIAIDANESLRPHVRALALDRLKNGKPADWRAIEQAALIVGSLHENSARDSCVALLHHQQWQVRIAAILALRRLRLPETLSAEFARAKEVAAEYKERTSAKAKLKPTPEDMTKIDEEIAQLLQNLGQAKMQESLSFVHSFIPKGSGWAESARTAAIWAAGKIQEGTADTRISRQLIDRMQDDDPQHPESTDVRVMSAISLARVKDKGSLSALRKTAKDGGYSRLIEAAKWAIASFEGTPYNGPDTVESIVNDWFLEPLD
jgi:HEAT repeat protein